MNISESIKTGAGLSIGVIVGLTFLFVILPCGVCGGLGILGSILPKPDRPARISSGASPSSADPRPASDVEVTLGEFLSAYDGNSVGADARYKSKNVKLTSAKVDLVSSNSFSGKPYITLGSTFGLGGVRCEVSDAASVVNLKPGDSITVQGYCDGKIASSIVLRRCFIP